MLAKALESPRPQLQGSEANLSTNFLHGDSMTDRKLHKVLSGTLVLAILVLASLSAAAFSQTTEKENFDDYKLRIDAG